jgi:hypothetical protein
VADAFQARQSRKRSAQRPEKPRPPTGAEVWGKRSSWDRKWLVLPWTNSENRFLLPLKMMLNGSFTRKNRDKW